MDKLNEKIVSLDLEKTYGTVTLSNGDELHVPKMSNARTIRLVKFLGIDLVKMYGDLEAVFLDREKEVYEKILEVMDKLTDEQIVKLLTIVLDIDTKTALELEPNETLDALIILFEGMDLHKTFLSIKKLYATIFRKELGAGFMDGLRDKMTTYLVEAQAEANAVHEAAVSPVTNPEQN